jgi:hypothetical protein
MKTPSRVRGIPPYTIRYRLSSRYSGRQVKRSRYKIPFVTGKSAAEEFSYKIRSSIILLANDFTLKHE